MDKIRDFLRNGSSESFEILSADDRVFWVDWREEDDAIIGYCRAALQTDRLEGECRGDDIVIIFDGKETVIPYPQEFADRDTTLITLNKVMKPAYEVRFWLDTVGADTLAFLALPVSSWELLETEFKPEKVRHHFALIEEDSRMFELSMDEVAAILKQRDPQV